MKFIKKHKVGVILGIIIFVVITFFIIALVNLLFSSYGKTKYGNRLDGIENVSISDDKVNDVKSIIKEIQGVTDVVYHLSGKTVNLMITVEKGTDSTTITSKETKILEKFSAEEIAFYDFQIFINNEEDQNYPVIGYKSKSNEKFSWTGQVVEDEE